MPDDRKHPQPQQQPSKVAPAPAPAPAPAADGGDLAAQVRALQATVARMETMLAERSQHRPAADAGETGERLRRVEKALELTPEDRAAAESHQQWAGLNAQDKSRLQVLARYADDLDRLPWYAVTLCHARDHVGGQATLTPDKAWPTLEIPAHSEQHAQSRYVELTTVRLTVPELQLSAVPLPGRPRFEHLDGIRPPAPARAAA